MQREEILAEIRRTAQENGGEPLGIARFEQITSIRPYDWQRYWPRFGDVLIEAGFAPNQFVFAYDEKFLLEKLVSLTRELGHFPTEPEKRIKGYRDPTFPDRGTFRHGIGNKDKQARKLLEYCTGKPGYDDVTRLLGTIDVASSNDNDSTNQANNQLSYGFVYLVKGHPGEYKIGYTNLVDRRLSELGVTASVKQELIHEIKTDDPSGVEDYWHKRFQEKRMRGEWFKLNSTDVRTFKRWKRIY